MPSTVLRELGSLGVETDGEVSSVRGVRMSAVVAALSLGSRTGVGTEELVEMIWPSPDQPPTARRSLANIVLRLRALYGSSFIESTGRGYRLGDHVQSDRKSFLAEVQAAGEVGAHAPDQSLDFIEQALGRWRGEPWAGLEGPVGVEADRAHLLTVRTAAIRIRATALIALNRRNAGLADLRELLDVDPYDEFARYHLVQALADTGQRAEALRTIQEAHRLFSERGLLVDAALIDIEQRLLSADFMSDTEAEPLPKHASDFVGRHSEIAAISDRLRDGWLVTVHGPGGSGKTRLAVHVASAISKPGRSGFVALTDTRSQRQVELAFARGLGVPANRLDGLDTDERRATLVNAAVSWPGLLVIDNCEHVIDHVRAIVGELLASGGQLGMLATSRLPLALTGEHRYPIPKFTDGVELFRRRSEQHGVPIDSDRQIDIVAEICQLVDHLPLAIEIAAAQTPYRTLDEVVGELGHGIAHRDETQPESRHESMSAAIRWSHQLLDPAAAAAFVRLGVFNAPFERADAAAVIDTDETSELLDDLVRNSLVERSPRDGHSTYRLAAPIQQYCSAELARQGIATDVAIRQADWLLEFTNRPYGEVWWRLSVIDEINTRLPHAISAVGALRAVDRIDDATRLASRLGGAAHLYGHADELIDILGELWPNSSDDEATADALLATALCADVARRPEFGPALGLLTAMEGPAGQRHRVYVHCLNCLMQMMAALMTDEDYGPAHDELRRARELTDESALPINRANIEHWDSGLQLLERNWVAAQAAALRALEDSADTVFDIPATSCLCHARLQLGDPHLAFHLATSHPCRTLDTAYGDRLGIVAAIAQVQRGDIDSGLVEISSIQRTAHRAPWAVQRDDLAIGIAYIAHILGHDDLTLQILETGVIGFGPWIGYLVPEICQDLQVPPTEHDPGPVLDRDSLGVTAARVLSIIRDRQAALAPSRR